MFLFPSTHHPAANLPFFGFTGKGGEKHGQQFCQHSTPKAQPNRTRRTLPLAPAAVQAALGSSEPTRTTCQSGAPLLRSADAPRRAGDARAASASTAASRQPPRDGAAARRVAGAMGACSLAEHTCFDALARSLTGRSNDGDQSALERDEAGAPLLAYIVVGWWSAAQARLAARPAARCVRAA